jgi:anthranilate synthase/aminodeoxychorismate synthase-like glutamine amidotransferase
MILLIDNYDSFSYNLVQLVGGILQDSVQERPEEIVVVRNDEMTIREMEELPLTHLILSPGPGRPKDAGICEEAILHFCRKIPILGVCLGHQAICEAFGGEITYARHLMHGKQSRIEIDMQSPLMYGLDRVMLAARYHSLVVNPDTLPEELVCIARDMERGEIMAVAHREYPLYGLQFHPESVLTPQGKKMMENFLAIKKGTEKDDIR